MLFEKTSTGKNEVSLVPAAITDTGCERELNEDRYAVVECESGVMWLVCDGMGGVTGGELAAQLAIDGIRRALEAMPVRTPSKAIKVSLQEANRIIVLRRQNQAFANMGTTVVSALIQDQEVAIGHVGDSRAYLVRGSSIQQLTKDHTYVQELVDKGEINQDDAMDHPDAHVLTRCIGAQPGLEIATTNYWIWKSEPGDDQDLLLLCSDGLYSHVFDKEIARICADNSPQRACAKLVELAKARGGYDNITVAIVPVGGQLRQEPPAGYTSRKIRTAKNKKSVEQTTGMSWPRYLAMVMLLSMVSSGLVLVGILMAMKQ